MKLLTILKTRKPYFFDLLLGEVAVGMVMFILLLSPQTINNQIHGDVAGKQIAAAYTLGMSSGCRGDKPFVSFSFSPAAQTTVALFISDSQNPGPGNNIWEKFLNPGDNGGTWEPTNTPAPQPGKTYWGAMYIFSTAVSGTASATAKTCTSTQTYPYPTPKTGYPTPSYPTPSYPTPAAPATTPFYTLGMSSGCRGDKPFISFSFSPAARTTVAFFVSDRQNPGPTNNIWEKFLNPGDNGGTWEPTNTPAPQPGKTYWGAMYIFNAAVSGGASTVAKTCGTAPPPVSTPPPTGGTQPQIKTAATTLRITPPQCSGSLGKVTFSWTQASGGTIRDQYLDYSSVNGQFAPNTFKGISVLGLSSWTVNDLASDTQYWWRVNTRFVGDSDSVWYPSAVSSFRTPICTVSTPPTSAPPPSADGPKPAVLAGIPQMSCNTQGRVNAKFAWTRAESQGKTVSAQWLDLSLTNNNFASGTFVNTGNPPSTTDTTYTTGTGQIGPLDAGKIHFWRLNTLIEGKWYSSAAGQFTAPVCTQQPSAPTCTGPITIRSMPLEVFAGTNFSVEVAAQCDGQTAWITVGASDKIFSQGNCKIFAGFCTASLQAPSQAGEYTVLVTIDLNQNGQFWENTEIMVGTITVKPQTAIAPPPQAPTVIAPSGLNISPGCFGEANFVDFTWKPAANISTLWIDITDPGDINWQRFHNKNLAADAAIFRWSAANPTLDKSFPQDNTSYKWRLWYGLENTWVYGPNVLTKTCLKPTEQPPAVTQPPATPPAPVCTGPLAILSAPQSVNTNTQFNVKVGGLTACGGTTIWVQVAKTEIFANCAISQGTCTASIKSGEVPGDYDIVAVGDLNDNDKWYEPGEYAKHTIKIIGSEVLPPVPDGPTQPPPAGGPVPIADATPCPGQLTLTLVPILAKPLENISASTGGVTNCGTDDKAIFWINLNGTWKQLSSCIALPCTTSFSAPDIAGFYDISAVLSRNNSGKTDSEAHATLQVSAPILTNPNVEEIFTKAASVTAIPRPMIKAIARIETADQILTAGGLNINYTSSYCAPTCYGPMQVDGGTWDSMARIYSGELYSALGHPPDKFNNTDGIFVGTFYLRYIVTENIGVNKVPLNAPWNDEQIKGVAGFYNTGGPAVCGHVLPTGICYTDRVVELYHQSQ